MHRSVLLTGQRSNLCAHAGGGRDAEGRVDLVAAADLHFLDVSGDQRLLGLERLDLDGLADVLLEAGQRWRGGRRDVVLVQRRQQALLALLEFSYWSARVPRPAGRTARGRVRPVHASALNRSATSSWPVTRLCSGPHRLVACSMNCGGGVSPERPPRRPGPDAASLSP